MAFHTIPGRLLPLAALCILLVSCIALCVEASGDKLFVVPNSAVGSKADCSEDFPCSLEHALAVAGAEAELEISEGHYDGNVVIHANQTGLSLNGAGASLTLIHSAGLVVNGNEIVLDVRAEDFSANRIGFAQTWNESNTANVTAQIGVLIRDTAIGARLDEVLVLYNSSGDTSTSRGVVIAGAPEVELKKTAVVGPWQDGIHLISSSSKVKQGLVDGATRIGIALINTNVSASSENKIKQVTIRNIGDGSTFGTAIEVQGNNNHVKEGEISNWGKYGIHVCGEAGPDKCDPCHYSAAVEELPDSDPLRTARHTSIKGVDFFGEPGQIRVCDGGEETKVKRVQVIREAPEEEREVVVVI
ncbi:hypothetical protein KFL_001740050 [Klebsormidium nitens]|uniref:Right handed beta helix domain-containing protein n=1 Tax=Klebsormidium nitens TaxID=105231 RepID=A0A1Y1I5Q6_KLENI|nr:hypothetical protein KFL_001740050 [Klebsormidium nitens]|eukprot:GAQ84046.1 hypothetical protein KFL_001740050 [Klebsormidium nitens]